MEDVLVIIHSPGVTEGQSKILVNKMCYFLERFNIQKAKIELNPALPIKSATDDRTWNTLVIGWGLSAEPAWDELLNEYEIKNLPQEFLAFDLFERRGFDRRRLHEYRVNAGRYWSRKVKERNLMLFIEGYYLKSVAPYGMTRVLRKPSKRKSFLLRSHYVLLPGDADEIEILKLIFDLFVNHDCSPTQISNLLTAQSINPPGKNVRWRTRVIRTFLKDPVYIGANEFKGSIRYNVFPSLIDKSTFYEAQAKIMREPITRKDVHVLNFQYNLSSRL